MLRPFGESAVKNVLAGVFRGIRIIPWVAATGANEDRERHHQVLERCFQSHGRAEIRGNGFGDKKTQKDGNLMILQVSHACGYNSRDFLNLQG
jgi:hypothetical protein